MSIIKKITIFLGIFFTSSAKPDENVKNKKIIEYLIMDMDLEKFFEHY